MSYSCTDFADAILGLAEQFELPEIGREEAVEIFGDDFDEDDDTTRLHLLELRISRALEDRAELKD
jgi:hypothetical protein